MRKLKTSDIPVFCRCLKKLNVKEQFRTIAQESDNIKEAWEKGFDLIWSLFDTATDKEGEVVLYELLSGPFEMTPEEVENLDLDILITNLKTLAAENNLMVFFKNAAKLMK